MTSRAFDVPPSVASVHADRLRAAADAAGERGLDALLITPSQDYRYLLGYAAPAMERLTCLIVPVEARPVLLLPRLEEPLARHQLGGLVDALELVAWDETDDPIRMVQTLVGSARRVGVQDQMWARFALGLQAALDPAQLVAAGSTMSALRRVKTADEVDLLRAAASAADRAMLAITTERLSGRTELEVARRIRELLIEAGHDEAGFAIVASGPNSASPHHEAGDRTIEPGDAIVLDIGGTLGGYSSDTSRTAFVGEPPAEFAALFAVLREAQRAACEAVRPGIPAADVDRVARELIADAGYGDAFLHRTGHGIGLETHEEPYIVASNDEPLVAGNAFSVEPGIYIRDTWGARIEDIVICTEAGGERLNTTSTDLYVVG
ncbi:MAG: aminopeptidase P family protein [Chloroflexota bacterium]|jgi:Xaa-Pro aminopeptidase|nr:aminopeptidase P family protein [Chloroflexota bacterium]